MSTKLRCLAAVVALLPVLTGCSTVRWALEGKSEPPTPVETAPPPPAPAVAKQSPPPRPDPKRAPKSKSTPPEVAEIPEPALDPAPQTAEPEPAPGVAELYGKGVSAMKNGLHDDALLYWELAWQEDPGYADVGDRLKKEYQVRGLAAYSRRNIEQAIRLWGKALRIDPEDRKTLAYISHAERQKTRIEEIPRDVPPAN